MTNPGLAFPGGARDLKLATEFVCIGIVVVVGFTHATGCQRTRQSAQLGKRTPGRRPHLHPKGVGGMVGRYNQTGQVGTDRVAGRADQRRSPVVVAHLELQRQPVIDLVIEVVKQRHPVGWPAVVLPLAKIQPATGREQLTTGIRTKLADIGLGAVECANSWGRYVR